MISNIQHILALGSNQLGQHLTVSSAVHRVLLHIVRLAHIIVPDTQLPSGLVHSPQDCSLVEEQRLSSVNKCVVKVRLPGLSWWNQLNINVDVIILTNLHMDCQECRVRNASLCQCTPTHCWSAGMSWLQTSEDCRASEAAEDPSWCTWPGSHRSWPSDYPWHEHSPLLLWHLETEIQPIRC